MENYFATNLKYLRLQHDDTQETLVNKINKLTTKEEDKINACEKSGVKEIRIHDFRHSHASLLISLGADALLVSKRLGHSNVAETLNTYSHLYPNKQQEIVNLLNKI